ncbi:tetratricopeptide repeat protein [Pontiellaceae bacterium B12227]|nr:tetratricopeptide repeat protein [Pontiellaceae bacterium B12227]
MRKTHLTILAVFTLLFVLKSVAQEPVPKPLSSRFPSIRASLDDGFFVLAEQQARGVLQGELKEDEVSQATLLLAHALWGQKRYSEMEKMLVGKTGDPGYIYWRARTYYELRQFEKALQELNTAGEDMTRSRYAPSVLRLKGHLELRTGRLDAAEATYIQFAADYPNNRAGTENQFDLAEVYSRQQRFPEAIAVYEKLAAGQNKDAAERAALKLGHVLYTKGTDEQVNRSRALLSGLATNDQTRLLYRIDAYVDLAALEQQAGEKDAAEAAMRSGIKLSPDARQRVPLKLELAKLLLSEGQSDAALKLLEECRAEAPSQAMAAELQLEKSKALYLAGRYQEAAGGYQVYLDVADDEEGLADAYYGKGLSLWQLGRYAEAAGVFDKAVKALKDPARKADALFKAADCCFQAGKLEDAEKLYRSFVTDFPTHDNMPNALYQLGLAQMKIGRRAEALNTLSILETNHADSPFAEMAALRTADVLRANKDWEAALAKYEQIGKVYSNKATLALSKYRQGLVLYEDLHRYEEAQKAFEAVIADYPDSEYGQQSIFMRGFCLAWLGKTEESVKTCGDFVEKNPDSVWTPKVVFWLGQHFYNFGEYKKAEPLFLRFEKDFKGHELAPRALYWAGRAAAAQSNYVTAIERYSEVAKNYPESDILPQTRFAQGDALTELGEFSRAVLAFEEIIKNYPESYLVNAAWGRKGDCQFSLATDNPARYAEAMKSYQAILDRPSAPLALKLHVENKIAVCLEKTNVSDKAFSRYMHVVYTFLNENVEHSPYSVTWFTRSAFGAAAIKEKQRAWVDAVQVYERVIEANVPAKEEAQKRIDKIKKENWLLFQQPEETVHVGTDG